MKNLIKISALALLAGGAATLTGTGIAAAHGGGPGGSRGALLQMEFADLDLNGDGQITVEDLQAKAQARFAAADTNSDGFLDETEVKAAAAARMAERMQAKAEGRGRHGARADRGPDMETRLGWMAERMIDRRDDNGDDKLSMDEHDAGRGMDRMIDRFDTDDDNAVSAEEFETAQKEAWARMRHNRGPRGGRN